MKNGALIRSPRKTCALLARRFAAAGLRAGLILASGQVWADGITLPDNSRPMTSVQLYMLYRNRSWKWADGAGLMEDEGRAFTAWSGTGKKATWATGRWIVTDEGRLCLKADWHTPTGTWPNKTCFSHRISGGTIYQRREPSGDWYIFRHAKPMSGDEFGKLVKEDLVSSKLHALEAPTKAKPIPEAAPRVKQIASGPKRHGELR